MGDDDADDMPDHLFVAKVFGACGGQGVHLQKRRDAAGDHACHERAAFAGDALGNGPCAEGCKAAVHAERVDEPGEGDVAVGEGVHVAERP